MAAKTEISIHLIERLLFGDDPVTIRTVSMPANDRMVLEIDSPLLPPNAVEVTIVIHEARRRVELHKVG